MLQQLDPQGAIGFTNVHQRNMRIKVLHGVTNEGSSQGGSWKHEMVNIRGRGVAEGD